MKVTALQDESLDALCWRYYGSTSGTVEAVMAANPGIAALGVALPAGTVVEMPAPVAIDQVRPLLQLFN
ncbi:tail protein X [Burkholderia gladioli]|uniref:Phage tail protein n=2 Tax=Burkholderia gladioli TaxID=28095 RepID=A0A095GKT5_BURGA|nr:MULTISPECIES: tail protein X [Burkholderia]AEA58853.1 Phage Tail Protein X [Burkholderia gladioli BSR3]AJW98000.1 phage Tail Protein X family protein [Burkholderia gladioli]ASD77686.1 phage tail protein [Burkholderia gladioli pv. gladioli]ATF85871.1 phage tail protein [Burkholderia gladioli pv. gladioli]AWY53404.1 phage tail protein [Burkholderia gladioli pv. gladioli]